MNDGPSKITWFSVLLNGCLVAGYTIGAGVLGLPITTGLSGFIPTSISMIIVWVILYGLAWFLAKLFIAKKDAGCDYVSLYAEELGSVGKWLSIIGFLIIYYGALTAYLSGAAGIIKGLFNLNIPVGIVGLFCFVVYTLIIIFGIKAVEKGNFIFMVILVISFIYLVCMIVPHMKIERFTYVDWEFTPCAFSILIFSAIPFLIVPTVCRPLNFSPKPIFYSLVIGGVISFLISYTWITVVIGALPLKGEGDNNLLYAYTHGISASLPLADLLKCKFIFAATALFSVLAISTSYLGTGIAIVGFVDDFNHFKIKLKRKYHIYAVAFLPSLIIVLIDPNIFLRMMNFVGGAGFCLAGGVMPALILIKKTRGHWGIQIVAYCILLILLSIVLLEILTKLGMVRFTPAIM